MRELTAKTIKPGLTLVWSFKCPLCKHEWTSENPYDYSVSEVSTTQHYLRRFQAKMKCSCCGFYVESDVKEVSKEEEK